MIEIFEITEVDDFTLDAVNHLLPQLSQSAQPISSGSLQDLARSEATRLFMAKEGNAILGMLSLVVFAIPTGILAAGFAESHDPIESAKAQRETVHKVCEHCGQRIS